MGNTNTDVYAIVTERIISALEKGVIPWRKPWEGAHTMPRNGFSGRTYNGINVFLLAWQGYADPRWMTFNQAKKAGLKVKAGESGTVIIFWNIIQKRSKDETGDTITQMVPLLRYYRVWNAEQVEGDLSALKPLPTVADWNPIEEAEGIICDMPNPPVIYFDGGDRAYYSPASDEIHVPANSAYHSPEERYATLFHELSHSTGHKTRLDRQGNGVAVHFGSELYSKEELVAEFSAAMLCATAGIDNTLDNSAAYIASWLTVLKGDTRLLVNAAAQAQRSADYILARSSAITDDESEG